MQWMLLPFRRYAEFSGRSRRKEYWMFALFNAIVNGVLLAIGFWGASERVFSSTDELTLYFGCTLGLYGLAAFIPGLAVTIRRLHDTDRSGWTILFSLIPIVGPLILLYFYVTEGTNGPNRFGEDPKAGE
jgi:uncharacterized membrane protein YhaH (DUF805 family)